jgi:DNA-binding XRE family transcriptional regulator
MTYAMLQAERWHMATVMIVDPKEMKEARNILGFTQIQAGVALGNVRPETVSRWERASRNNRPNMRGIHVETTRQLIETADLLVNLYPDKEDRMRFLHAPRL